MPLAVHIAILGVLVLDLIFGGAAVDHLVGRLPAAGFEFLLILGYVIFVLRLFPPWRRREDE